MPILAAEIVRATAQMIANMSFMKTFSNAWKAVGVKKSGLSVGFKIVTCRNAGEIFSFRVCPLIFGCTGNVYKMGGVCRKQIVLIKGERVLSVGVFRVMLTEPLGEALYDLLDGFTFISS